MITSTQWEHINEIMDNFDFRRVAITMRYLKWGWGMAPNTHIPEENELRQYVRARMVEMHQRNLTYMDSGGFRVERSGDAFTVSFVLTDWQTYDDSTCTEGNDERSPKLVDGEWSSRFTTS
jgi:hypothetical protein